MVFYYNCSESKHLYNPWKYNIEQKVNLKFQVEETKSIFISKIITKNAFCLDKAFTFFLHQNENIFIFWINFNKNLSTNIRRVYIHEYIKYIINNKGVIKFNFIVIYFKLNS